MPRRRHTGIIRLPGKKPKAYVAVRVDGKRQQRAKRFPIGTLDSVMLAWIEKTRDHYAPVIVAHGSFAEDVLIYLALPAVAAMRSVKQKAAHLALWVAALGGDRPRASITRDDIEAVLQAWLQTLAAPTVYHRRTALQSLYVALDGPHADNPVRRTTCPAAWQPRDQSVPFSTLVQILAAMPDARYVRRGIRQPSAAKVIAAVLLHTGVRGGDLLAVRRPDVNWSAATVQMPRSDKGQGAASWTLRLTAEGLAAWRAFDLANLYGAFDPAAVSHSYKRACRRVLGDDTPVHLYSMRHSVGADVYRETKDLATVGRLLGHTLGSRVTAQYARGANADVDRAALTALSAARAAEVPQQTTAPPALRPARTRRDLRKVSNA